MGVHFLKFDVPFDVYRKRGHRIRELRPSERSESGFVSPGEPLRGQTCLAAVCCLLSKLETIILFIYFSKKIKEYLHPTYYS
jgi:hypothetical protein